MNLYSMVLLNKQKKRRWVPLERARNNDRALRPRPPNDYKKSGVE